MCYEELFISRLATKKERERAERASQGELQTPRTQPDRPKPESESPRRPEHEPEHEPELEPV
jgi:hypothetical protein